MDIFDKLHNIPTAIGGSLASPCPILSNGNSYFLVNASLDEGTSVPIITKFKSSWGLRNGKLLETGFAIFLLGINSSTFPSQDGEEPKQFNATYFASTIEEMTG